MKAEEKEKTAAHPFPRHKSAREREFRIVVLNEEGLVFSKAEDAAPGADTGEDSAGSSENDGEDEPDWTVPASQWTVRCVN